MNEVFLDVSLGALRGVLWHAVLKEPYLRCLPLSSTSPLSSILPSFWTELYRPTHSMRTQAICKKLFFLQGPGPLTSLRVLFAHILALKAAHPNIEFWTLPTPLWLQFYLHQQGSVIPKSFIHQVGRFAFITGINEQLETYKTHHIRNDEAWTSLLKTLPPPVVFIGPQPFSKTSAIWIQPQEVLVPQHIYPTLKQFHQLHNWSDFSPIQSV